MEILLSITDGRLGMYWMRLEVKSFLARTRRRKGLDAFEFLIGPNCGVFRLCTRERLRIVWGHLQQNVKSRRSQRIAVVMESKKVDRLR